MKAIETPAVGSILGCGHVLSPNEGECGYCVMDGATYCYPCADDHQRSVLLTAREAFGYLSESASGGPVITTWTGGMLMRVVGENVSRVRYTPSGGRYQLTYVNAVDVHGQRWHGTSPGRGMYARLRRTAV